MRRNQLIACVCLTLAVLLYFEPWQGITSDPLPGTGLRAAMVYESNDLLDYPAQQQASLQSATLRKELEDKGWSIRLLDKDLTDQGEPWQDILDMDHGTLPKLYIGNGRRAYRGDVPGIEDMKGLFNEYSN